ncbi:LacI family DNA-binding transcriptional regulator [Agromyces sp. SYSU T00266]|uniref:LacI family DNA-binding transcriptional regulator n=1 Tax=Agromyces zhanjiangensis TaxID=3158562 RepID=UPI00339A45D4
MAIEEPRSVPEAVPGGEATTGPRVARSTLRRVSAGRAGRAATIYDVALAAGVSHQTVTRYLNGFAGIRPATRERVEKALKELDYRPNLAARALNSGRSQRVGAITHELDQFGPSKILQGATTAARDAGFVLDIVTVDLARPDVLNEAIEMLRRHDLAGVLVMSSTDTMSEALATADFGVPVYLGAEPDDTSGTDPSELTQFGFPALFDHLVGLGHHTFLHIAGPAEWSAARNRSRAYSTALAARGLSSAGVLQGDWSARSGYEAVMAAPDLAGATAIVAANDQMALGAILALTERGLRVPEDVSVAGVDDIPEAAYFSPPLTTLRVDFAAQGRAAFSTLLHKIRGEAHALEPALHADLIVRRSTARAPASG